jgi:hypothetical protein
VKPETRTVTQLFEAAAHYVAPLFQRPYVWKRIAIGDPERSGALRHATIANKERVS